jgi:hypothetical protein
MVEEHMVIGTQAKDVVCGIRSVVRCAERAYVRGFSVRTGKALKADTAHLTPAVMELLDPPRLPSISYDRNTVVSCRGAAERPDTLYGSDRLPYDCSGTLMSL